MKKVLIVEDQADIRKLIRMTLENEPYELHEAASGEEALRVAASVLPDLVLLDLILPGAVDGLQVCRAIRADTALAEARVVMLTARSRASDRVAGVAAGADQYLVKPFSPLQLLESVDQLLQAR